MIYDLLDVFEKVYDNQGDSLILDNYVLKDGLYVKVKKDNSLEYYIFQNDKKEKNKEHCFVTLDKKRVLSEVYDWFKAVDYYSSYLNSNKAFFDKKIHNINYLSFFVKLESFVSKDTKKLLHKDAIKGHFEALSTYSKFTKKEEKKILQQEKFQQVLTNETRKKALEENLIFVQSHIQNFVALAQEYGVSNYIKIFFDEEVQRYQAESELYYAIKIFNDISHSKTLESFVYGLSNSNMGLNAKKPFLEQKTRKIVAPFMLLDKDALKAKKFFDWLKFQDYANKTPSGEQFFLNRDFKEKDLVTDFDYLPTKVTKLDDVIYYKNHVNAFEDKKLLLDKNIESLEQLEVVVDEVFYNKQLIYNYYAEVYKKLDKGLSNLIYLTREGMHNYFKKSDERAFYKLVQTHATAFVLEHLRKNRNLNAKKALNLKLSLLAHKGHKIMNIKNMQEQMHKRLQTNEYTDLTEQEFFYLSGQVVKYLLNQSEKHEKKADMLEPFLRANNAQKLKKDIEQSYFKYKHALSLNAKTFNNALSMLMAFEHKTKLAAHMDDFLIGTLSNNIFYMKKEEK